MKKRHTNQIQSSKYKTWSRKLVKKNIFLESTKIIFPELVIEDDIQG